MATIERNPGTPLDLGWVYDARVNRSAAERRTDDQFRQGIVKIRRQFERYRFPSAGSFFGHGRLL